eukprot:m.123323 g.123323  ORF g.123323 m.123323 type:complete len:77 (+) comp37820_c0_seq1:391-621(+)
MEWYMQISFGLQHIHNMGIVHRDLKPKNILIAHNEEGIPVLKIADVSVAKAAWSDDDGGLASYLSTFVGTQPFYGA